MPLIYRAMRAAGDGPLIGHLINDTLGVREVMVGLDGKEQGDIKSVDGMVYPETGGMSVSPSKTEVPDHLIPKRLRNQGYPGARRGGTKPETFPWRTGEGAFIAGPLCDKLQFRPDPDDLDSHGFVEPDGQMTLQEYREAIEATRSSWIREQW